MDKRPTVLVVPFSAGASKDVAVRAAYICLELYKGGFEVVLQDCNKLTKRSTLPEGILQIGIGELGEELAAGLSCLGALRLMYPEIPRVVISEWNAEDLAKQLNWDPKAAFLHWPYGGEAVLVQTMREAVENKNAPSQ